MWALGGDDAVLDGPGDDLLRGGAGNDRIRARDGERDVVRRSPGFDVAWLDALDVMPDADCERILLLVTPAAENAARCRRVRPAPCTSESAPSSSS